MTDTRASLAAAPPEPDDSIFRDIADSLAGVAGLGNGKPLSAVVKEKLDKIIECVGERWIGGPWNPAGDLPVHTVRRLEEIVSEQKKKLAADVESWSAGLGPKRVHLLMYLWWECWLHWDRSLAYRALRMVAEVVHGATAAQTGQTEQGDWEPAAWRAVGKALGLITADTDVFKQVNMSNAAGLAAAAENAAQTAEATGQAISSALAALGTEPGQNHGLTASGLRYIEAIACQSQILYSALVLVAETLIEFESWLEQAQHEEPAQSSSPATRSHRSHAQPRTPLASIDAALEHVRRVQGSLDGVTLSRCEPWERLLVEMRELITSSRRTATAAEVFVPKRVLIRYCYPFAVEENEQRSLHTLHPSLARPSDKRPPGGAVPRLALRLQQELDDAFGPGLMAAGEPEDLHPTEFFHARDAKDALYGGVRTPLPDVEFIGDDFPGVSDEGHRTRGRMWIDLSRMGNHCLCIELATPLEGPAALPHRLYRALRAGTPFVVGERVALVAPTADTKATGSKREQVSNDRIWDDLHALGRDIIRATANAFFFEEKHHGSDVAPFRRGSLREVVIVQTAGPLGTQPEEIAAALDRSIGGRVLLRSVQRSASTLEEWTRFPPLLRTERRGQAGVIAVMPELGFTGDWFVHTGETTVFGLAASPSWLRAVYAEAAQFASSWSPLLRLWSKRLQSAIEAPRRDDAETSSGEDLRKVEQQVRRHLSQIKSEEICATLAHRRFLDELLEVAGVARLETELEMQLEAAEKLIDWFNDHRRRMADQRRNVLLFVIGLLAVFDLATYIGLANQTGMQWNLFIKVREGTWEVWAILVIFVLFLVVGFLLFGAYGWLRRSFGTVRRRPGRKHSGDGSPAAGR